MRQHLLIVTWPFLTLLFGLVPASSQNVAISREQPYPTIVSNIHNAPGWLPSHAYSPSSGPSTRVVNGAGWDPATGAFIPRRALAAYQLISDACTSGTSGGPSGRGGEIVDGTCTWKYLSGVDYISLTGWAFDNRALASADLQLWRLRRVRLAFALVPPAELDRL